MKVKELKEYLNTLDEEMEVMYIHRSEWFYPVTVNDLSFLYKEIDSDPIMLWKQSEIEKSKLMVESKPTLVIGE